MALDEFRRMTRCQGTPSWFWGRRVHSNENDKLQLHFEFLLCAAIYFNHKCQYEYVYHGILILTIVYPRTGTVSYNRNNDAIIVQCAQLPYFNLIRCIREYLEPWSGWLYYVVSLGTEFLIHKLRDLFSDTLQLFFTFFFNRTIECKFVFRKI